MRKSFESALKFGRIALRVVGTAVCLLWCLGSGILLIAGLLTQAETLKATWTGGGAILLVVGLVCWAVIWAITAPKPVIASSDKQQAGELRGDTTQ